MEQIQNNLPPNFYDLPPALRVQTWNRILSAMRQNVGEINSVSATKHDYTEVLNLLVGNETELNDIEMEMDWNDMRVELDLARGL